jgi:hypothetical protein
MKNLKDHIGKQTSVLLACSAVPQPAAPPRASVIICTISYNADDCAFHPHSMLMSCSQQTEVILLRSAKWLVFVTDKDCVLCEVRTKFVRIRGTIVRKFNVRFAVPPECIADQKHVAAQRCPSAAQPNGQLLHHLATKLPPQ